MSDQEELMRSLKKEVRSLLTPAKEGLTPFHLEQEYRYLVGKQLPFRSLGYHSVMELIKDMPDVVKICPMANGSVILRVIADECTKQIANLVARQKSKPKPPFYKQRMNYMRYTGPLWHPQSPLILPRRGRLPPTLPAVVKSELKELLKLSPVLLSNFDKMFFQYFGRKFELSRYGFYSMSEMLNAASDIITIVQTKTGSLLTLKDIPPKKQTNKLLKVIQPNEMKQTSHTAVLSPVVNTGLSTDDQTKSPREKCDTSQPQLKMETPLLKSEERFEQFSVDSLPPLSPPELQKEIKAVLANKGPGGIVSSELKEKIKNIVAQHPEGLLVSKLPQEFEAHFKEALPVKKLGFLNLMELIGALSDVLHIECKEGEQDWLIFSVDSQSLKDDEKQNVKTDQSGSLVHEDTSDEHSVPCWDFSFEDTKSPVTKFNVVTKMATPYFDMEIPGIMQEIVENEIPPDAAQDRSLFSLPELDNGTLMGVFVEYIVSPSQFYVRIYSAETSDKLEDMMIEMRSCYSSKSVIDRYIISEALIRPGQLCCVRNRKGKWWYRAIIHRMIDDQQVEAFYPDFGNMDIVQKSSLRFLKDCYAKLPAQAIPCSLAWVKPTKDDWTLSASLEFQRLCELKLLVGVVDEYIDGVLHLFLCDTSSDEDIYLHNVLKLEGHAFIYSENIPSKGFKKMNFSTLYLKPSPKQEADLTEKADSFLQQESLGDLSDTTDSGFCKSEDGFQDTASSYLNSEMPYLEPVYSCKEVWDENLMPSYYYEEKKNGDIDDNLCSDIAVLSCQMPNCEEIKNETRQSQDFMSERKDISSAAAERNELPDLEPLNQILDSSGKTETTIPVGATYNALLQNLEKFDISVARSEKSDLGQFDVTVNNCTSQSFPSTSALDYTCALMTKPGEASSEKKIDDTSKTQVVSLRKPGSYCGPNALMFTAELHGSSAFCVPCSPAVAMGASARLATSGGYFSLNLRNMKTSGQMALGKFHCSAASLDTTVKKLF
nr:tudor domain-containing protein 5 [Anolis sagrei ordinatus]